MASPLSVGLRQRIQPACDGCRSEAGAAANTNVRTRHPSRADFSLQQAPTQSREGGDVIPTPEQTIAKRGKPLILELLTGIVAVSKGLMDLVETRRGRRMTVFDAITHDASGL
jgi:hypothetical protein